MSSSPLNTPSSNPASSNSRPFNPANAWKSRKNIGDKNKERDLAAFLPAALEIQETPPNPIAKWAGRSLIFLFTFAVLWAIFGHIDVVASAEGKIIPSSRIKKIQPLEKAVVKTILVSEGQSVQQGEALVELDATLTNADEARIRSELNRAYAQLSVSESLLNLLELPSKDQANVNYESLSLITKNSQATTGIDVNVIDSNLYRRLLWQQWQDFRAQTLASNSSVERNKAEKAATQEVIIKLEQTLPIITKRAMNMKSLRDKNYATETDYLALEQERIQQKQDLAAERQRLKQIQAAVEEVDQQRQVLAAQARANQLNIITETQRQVASLKEELNKASDLNAKQILYAPVSGQVQQLAINTVGGVVTEAQELMVIVPDAEQLEVEVVLQNKDIGFVFEGMPSEIKIHTFPFTKYGVIDGEVTNVSNDAIVDEQQGLIYTMRVAMDKNVINVGSREVKLMPGMSVTAEVKTDKRRIIEFFLAPLLRYGKEGLRER